MNTTETTTVEHWRRLLDRRHMKGIRNELEPYKTCQLDTDGDGNCQVHPDGCPNGVAKLNTAWDFCVAWQKLRKNPKWTRRADNLIVQWAEAVVVGSSEAEAEALYQVRKAGWLGLCVKDYVKWFKKGLVPYPHIAHKVVALAFAVANPDYQYHFFPTVIEKCMADKVYAAELMNEMVKLYKEFNLRTIGRDGLRSGIRTLANDVGVEIPVEFLVEYVL